MPADQPGQQPDRGHDRQPDQGGQHVPGPDGHADDHGEDDERRVPGVVHDGAEPDDGQRPGQAERPGEVVADDLGDQGREDGEQDEGGAEPRGRLGVRPGQGSGQGDQPAERDGQDQPQGDDLGRLLPVEVADQFLQLLVHSARPRIRPGRGVGGVPSIIRSETAESMESSRLLPGRGAEAVGRIVFRGGVRRIGATEGTIVKHVWVAAVGVALAGERAGGRPAAGERPG